MTTAPADRSDSSVLDTGSGSAVLLLHGTAPGTTAHGNFAELLPALAGYRVLAPDLLGFGDSAKPVDCRLRPGTVGPAGLAAARRRAGSTRWRRRQLDGRPHRPHHGSRAARADTRVGVAEHTRRGLATIPGPEAVARVHPEPGRHGAAGARVLRDRPEHRHPRSGPGAATRPAPGRAHTRPCSVSSQDSPPHRHSIPPTLAEFTAPVLLLHGREDRIVPADNGLRLAELLPHADLHLLAAPGTGSRSSAPRTVNTLDHRLPDPVPDMTPTAQMRTKEGQR